MPSLFFLVLITLYSGFACAETNEEDLKQLRKWFSRAESIAHSPNSSESKFLSKKLEDYPLAPYVHLKTLMRYPFLSNKTKIDAFLTKYEGSPLDRPLRMKWLKYLAGQNQQAMFLHYYRDIGDDGLRCHNIQFRLARPELRQAALEEIDELWLVGKSQPKACDTVFDEWTNAGRRTEDMVYERLKLAANGGNQTLIPYLKTLLPEDKQYLADLWMKVRRSPSYVNRASRFPGKYPHLETDILSYGLKRLIWKERDLALKSWASLSRQFPFTDEQKKQITERFALGLVIVNHPKSEQWLERANDLTSDEELFRWHLAHVLRDQDWNHAMEVINSAPEDLTNSESFQYWTARTLEKLQAKDKATIQFQNLSEKRDYYGFMASGKLDKAPSIVDKPLSFTEQELLLVANHPAALRAYEFLQLKRFTSARREWRYLVSLLSEEQKNMAAVLADSWGWHDQAIRTFAKAGYMDDVSRRFPLAYRDTLENSAMQNNISPAWAFAIARRESSFMADANSGAGARGLMQLLPGTARYLEKDKVKNRELYDPDFNVQLGTKYLRYLMDRMDNNPILATASYNAGWRRVKDWLPDNGNMPMDIWVENIPYKETRDYVKAVMAYKQIYLQQLGKEENLFKDFTHMKIPQSGSF